MVLQERRGLGGVAVAAQSFMSLPPRSMCLTGELTRRSLRQESWLMHVHGLMRTNWDGQPGLFCSACNLFLSPDSVESITYHTRTSGHINNLLVLRQRHMGDDKDHASRTVRAPPMKSKTALKKPASKTVRALPMKSKTAFAALKRDGSIETWGSRGLGGDSSAVQAQLRAGVQEVFATENAFAALMDDRSIVTWGCSDSGAEPVAGGRAASLQQ